MNKLQSLYAAAGFMLFSGYAAAASVIPATALDAVTTDALDTAEDLAVKGLPLVAGMALAWFIVSGTKKILGKAGVR